MVYNIYSVRDDKTFFADPFIDVNDESASRGFTYALVNRPNLMSFSPADFRLYRLGVFDSESGMITCDAVPTFVCDASSLLRKETFSDET